MRRVSWGTSGNYSSLLSVEKTGEMESIFFLYTCSYLNEMPSPLPPYFNQPEDKVNTGERIESIEFQRSKVRDLKYQA